jgi:hypothetical protein
MKNRPTQSDDRLSKPKRKRSKSKKSLLLPIVGGVLLFCLISAVGAGIGGYFYFRGKTTDVLRDDFGAGGGKKRAPLSELFQGHWKGSYAERPRLKLTLDVAPDKFIFSAVNVVVNEGGTFHHTWKPVKLSENILVIRQEQVESGKSHDWEITFNTDDQIRVKSLTDNGIIGDFTRIAIAK